MERAVPPDNVERPLELLCRFEEKDPNDPTTWYTGDRRPHARAEFNNTGMVEAHNHQYLRDNRG